MSRRVVIYYRYDRPDRWFRGDEAFRRPIRRLLRGPDRLGGVDLVYWNLCAGLDRAGITYQTNIPFAEIRTSDMVGVIGRDRASLAGYDKPNPIVAGVAVTQHPLEWPTLFDDYPVARYVVHSEWVRAIYEKFYGPRITLWPVGIDTEAWIPAPADRKSVDILIYDKIRWNRGAIVATLGQTIRVALAQRGLSSETIRYGAYNPSDLKAALARTRAMLFLCEHESQGLAYQQAMSAGIPILAWEPGQWLDPIRFGYGESIVPCSSVPFFDDRCGLTFSHALDFEGALDAFLERQRSGALSPRAYVLDNLELAACARHYVDILKSVN